MTGVRAVIRGIATAMGCLLSGKEKARREGQAMGEALKDGRSGFAAAMREVEIALCRKHSWPHQKRGDGIGIMSMARVIAHPGGGN